MPELINKMLQAIHTGTLNLKNWATNDIFTNQVKSTAQYFLSAVMKAFIGSKPRKAQTDTEVIEWGWNKLKYNNPDKVKLQHMAENIYQFSAAKNYNQLKELSLALTKGDKTLSFPEFKQQAQSILNDYNLVYLETEYNLAIAQAQMASKWQKFKAQSVPPLLKYVTMHDDRVREEHRELDGITLPADHKFWNTYYPPNGWNCRCTVIYVNAAPHTLSHDIPAPTLQKGFNHNLAEQGYVFPPTSAYFVGAPKDIKPFGSKLFKATL